MKKVLLVVHGNEFPQSTLDFVVQLNEREPVLLTGLFLPEIVPIANWAAYSAESAGSLEDVVTATNITLFKEQCKQHQIEYRIHEGTNELGVPQIVKETRYADLLIADSDTFYVDEKLDESVDNLKKVLHKSECSVLVTAKHMRFPKKIMVAYDGNEACVYAMKQFTYLFPDLCTLETEIVHIADNERILIPDKEQLQEWAARHFSKLSIHPVTYSAGEYFASESNSEPVLIITGSFGRSPIAQLLRSSFSENLIDKYNLLLFTAHP